jgi:hypothetical protein
VSECRRKGLKRVCKNRTRVKGGVGKCSDSKRSAIRKKRAQGGVQYGKRGLKGECSMEKEGSSERVSE